MDMQEQAVSFPWKIQFAHTQDASDHAKLEDWLVRYEQLSCGKFNGVMLSAHFLNFQIFREIYNQSVYQTGAYSKEGTICFGFPIRSEGYGGTGGHRVRNRDLLCIRGGEELDFRSSQNIDLIGVCIEEAELFELADALGYSEIGKKIEARILRSPQAAESLVLTLNSLTSVLMASPEVLNHQSIQHMMKDTITNALFMYLNSVEAEDTLQMLPSYARRRSIVEKARSYMLQHLDRPVTMLELCRAAAVSQRTLQYCFEAVYATNPMHYLKLMRLNGLRRTLKLAYSTGASVQSAAETWGFWHLSRLAKEYRELFGELPSETLKSSLSLTTRDQEPVCP